MSRAFMCYVTEGVETHHYQCPSMRHDFDGFYLNRKSKPIPHFWSHEQAKEEGWCFTKDRQWPEDGEIVGVCPSCINLWKKEMEENELV